MNPRRVLRNALIFIMAASVFGFFIVKTDPRWNNVMTSATVAWNTKDNSAWLNDRPNQQIQVLPNGQPVEGSAYLRTVMLKEGLLIVKEHPFGVGYGRNAFGHALKAKYGEGSGHSHSGLLDIAISIGIPGLLLWLALLICTLRLAWKASVQNHTFPATALLLLTLNYGIRGIFDSVIRDHMLEQFMFTAGALLLMTLLSRETARESA
jgi:O-antigen ligase